MQFLPNCFNIVVKGLSQLLNYIYERFRYLASTGKMLLKVNLFTIEMIAFQL